MDDILLNKVEIIERCLKRITEEYQGYEAELETNYTKQDSIILNLLRACEASIDTAMHLVRVRKLGVPQQSKHAFELLEKEGVLNPELAQRLQSMVGFRNIAVHNYRKLDMNILRIILEKRLTDFREYTKRLIDLCTID